jgi:excinuclease ABC subunit A
LPNDRTTQGRPIPWPWGIGLIDASVTDITVPPLPDAVAVRSAAVGERTEPRPDTTPLQSTDVTDTRHPATTDGAGADSMIRVRGARLHTLQDIDVDIPRHRVVAFTGISGSGKSSLAFGTIHGEAQRRYFDTVAPYARRLIHLAGDPKVRLVEGLPPAVSLEQRPAIATARSSVGTITTTSNTLRMLYSRCGDYPPGTPRMDSDHFSTNTPQGACPTCSGLGVVHEPTEASMVPDPGLSIADGAIAAYPGAWQGKNYRDILGVLGYDTHRPWRDLPQAERDWILFTDEEPVVTVHAVREAGRIQRPYQGKYASAARYLRKTLAETGSASLRAAALRHVATRPCPTCHGRRFNPASLTVSWQGLPIDEILTLPGQDLVSLTRSRRDELSARSARDATGQAELLLTGELTDRLESVVELGLGHLALGRSTTTLSGGELQRLRLATLLRSGLFGVVYVLDEPTAGLHPKDLAPLLKLLRELVDGGNTVLVVEHDMETVRSSDWVIDVGPGAGTQGGRILYSGDVHGLSEAPGSVTARYLNDPVHRAEIRDDPAPRAGTGELTVSGITRFSLTGVTAIVPLGELTVVTGVSGSGKSTLLDAIHGAVAAGLAEAHDLDTDEPVESDREPVGDENHGVAAGSDGTAATSGTGVPVRLVRITQKPIGRSPRSTLATYTGLFDHVRKLFAATPLARERHYTPGRFSFNVTSGRCPTCQGEGAVTVELLFMPGTYATCPTCDGARYNPETLEITWHGRTIADILDLTVDDALEVFADQAPVRRAVVALRALGLGYLTLGQPATTLSGGEAQRIKLATELQRDRRRPTLYLLDEPTQGLHPADVHLLLRQLHGLVDAGHTVVIAEHHAAAIATADHEIEMGPGAGPDGGRIVYHGSPRPPHD